MRQDNHADNAIEPIAVSERRGAQMISVSPRLFQQLEKRGDIHAIQIPGVRRKLFLVEELRATVQRWKKETT